MTTLRLRTLSLLAALGSILLSGCIEESTVIKIDRDGSGVIHERSYTAATDNVISLSGKNRDKKDAEPAEAKLPSEAALKRYAATLGTGVTFKSVKASTNKKGWKGYEILYAFEDINTVRYARDTPKPDSDDDKEKKKNNDDDDFTTTFAMVDGKLSMNLERDGFRKTEPAPAQQPGSPTIDPYADTTGPSPIEMNISSAAMNEEMVKAMTKGMRMGIFVQIDGEIADTNAAYRNGNLITLFNVDLGTMLENEGGMAALKQLETVDRATFQTLSDEFDGLDIDLQEPIVVEFK
ncbi:MAG: hypothetical protein ACR2RV_07795 [Verrucomicrobiales bacterium]